MWIYGLQKCRWGYALSPSLPPTDNSADFPWPQWFQLATFSGKGKSPLLSLPISSGMGPWLGPCVVIETTIWASQPSCILVSQHPSLPHPCLSLLTDSLLPNPTTLHSSWILGVACTKAWQACTRVYQVCSRGCDCWVDQTPDPRTAVSIFLEGSIHSHILPSLLRCT